MIEHYLIRRIVEKRNLVVPTLLKPVQFGILEKIIRKKRLNENEKRYLRGNMRKKLVALQEITKSSESQEEIIKFLNYLDSCYITGLEALKHNGYGWYFEPKIIEIINTRVDGKIMFRNKILRLIRVKSIRRSRTILDKETGIKYATNEQIIRDTIFTKNKYTKTVWLQMFKRYGKIFIKRKVKDFGQQIDYSKYGV